MDFVGFGHRVGRVPRVGAHGALIDWDVASRCASDDTVMIRKPAAERLRAYHTTHGTEPTLDSVLWRGRDGEFVSQSV